jgi:hypothetical protein
VLVERECMMHSMALLVHLQYLMPLHPLAVAAVLVLVAPLQEMAEVVVVQTAIRLQ